MSLQEVDIEKAAGTDQETPADSNSTLDNNKRSGSGSTAPGDLVHQGWKFHMTGALTLLGEVLTCRQNGETKGQVAFNRWPPR